VTTVVLMVRHASHDRLGKMLCGRMPGVRLSEEGREEAEALGRRLSARRLAAVYASPLERARETAEPIARAQQLEVTVDPDLNEIDFGGWTGLPFEELHAEPAWPLWNSRRDLARPPGGETMLEVQARLVRFLERLRQRHAEAEVAMVSHSDVIKAALAHVLGLSLDHYDRFEISPASVSRVAAGDWGAKVHSINEAAA
jgi:probable phosphomutase (TIGR03848 family)